MRAKTWSVFVAFCWVIAGLIALVPAASAQTNCTSFSNVTLASATTITATPAYQPFSGSTLTFSFNLTVQNANNAPCSIAVILARPTAPLVMNSGGFTLNYALDFNGNNVVNIGTPSTGYFLTAPGNGSGTFATYNMTIAANQTAAAAGNYADNQVVLYLYGFRAGDWRLVRTYTLTLGASINTTCTMSAPSPATLNFTSAISQGIPNPGVVLSSSLPGVNCTAPARVTLSGSAMQHTPSVAAVSGFDNFINWQATATLGSATATLATNSQSSVTSSGYNVPSGTTVGGTVGVDVNLIAGQRLQSGTYSGVVTVTVDPTL
ncbi:MAG: hypothetical protein KDJ18_10225 [Hyphomicrobiaceae bacterium]|nr:hypothetical protein [Hyphomicrobiaceae bacterium]